MGKRLTLPGTKRKKRLAFRKILWVIFFILLFFAGGLFWRSDLLRFRRLDCFLENQPCPQETWAGIFDLITGRSLLSFSRPALEEKISRKYPQFSQATAKIVFPDKLTVSLRARDPLLLTAWLSSLPPEGSPSAELWLADWEGIVLEKSLSPSSLPVVFFLSPSPPPLSVGFDFRRYQLEKVFILSRLLLEKGLVFTIGQTEVKEQKLTVRLASGPQVTFSLEKDGSSQVGSLQLILARAKMEQKTFRSADLRFAKPVVVFD